LDTNYNNNPNNNHHEQENQSTSAQIKSLETENQSNQESVDNNASDIQALEHRLNSSHESTESLRKAYRKCVEDGKDCMCTHVYRYELNEGNLNSQRNLIVKLFLSIYIYILSQIDISLAVCYFIYTDQPNI
jgi:hypothetical protein